MWPNKRCGIFIITDGQKKALLNKQPYIQNTEACFIVRSQNVLYAHDEVMRTEFKVQVKS